jgi:homoserine O-acetyltransferase
MVSCTSDMLFPTVYNQQMVEILQNQRKDARLYKIESIKGHMAGIFYTHLFSNQVVGFLS